MYNYCKLLGCIKENGMTQSELANAINISERSLSSKLNNKVNFKQDEIERIISCLKIKEEDINSYFFNKKVQ